MNLHQLHNGIPIKKTSRPIEKPGNPSRGANKKKYAAGDTLPTKELNAMEYISHGYIQRTGMDQLEEFQPNLELGGRILLEELPNPSFTENLLQLQAPTKLSPHETMRQNLSLGHGLPIWGSCKNAPTKKAKEYLQQLFTKGQTSKPLQPVEAEAAMFDAEDESGEPLFDENTYMDQEQIKAYFASLSRDNRKIKRSTPASKRRNVSSATGFQAVPGLDYEDDDNTEDLQNLDEEMADNDALEGAAAIHEDAIRIQNVLQDIEKDSDVCPITIMSVDLCALSEEISWAIGDPLSKLTPEQKEAIVAKIEPDESKRTKNKRQLRIAICNYIKQKCNCASTHYF